MGNSKPIKLDFLFTNHFLLIIANKRFSFFAFLKDLPKLIDQTILQQAIQNYTLS